MANFFNTVSHKKLMRVVQERGKRQEDERTDREVSQDGHLKRG